MDYILLTAGVSKIYGKQRALDNVNIHVKQGDIYGLIGRNGAGKTTLLKIVTGLAKQTCGDFTVFGRSSNEMREYHSRIGSLIEAPGLYPQMTAEENLKIKCMIMGEKDRNIPCELLKTVGLSDVGKKKTGRFSLGMKQRLGMALALVGHPDIVILDEPINGLDPQGIIEIRNIIHTLNKERGITFIISSHILAELSRVATVYGIINKGVIVEELSAESLYAKCSERLELMTDNPRLACTVIEQLGITSFKVLDSGMINIFDRIDRSGDITLALASRGIKTMHISVENESLEDYYIGLVGEDGGNR